MKLIHTLLPSVLLLTTLPGLAQNQTRKEKAEKLINAIQIPQNLSRTPTAPADNVSAQCLRLSESLTTLDPNTRQPMKVTLTTYLGPKTSKTVIVLPPTGGVSFLDHEYANRFCEAGMTAIILESWEGNEIVTLQPEMHDQNALRAIAAVRSLVATIPQDQSISVFGNSVGGILGSLVLGTEDRIQSGLFVVAGGNMAEIIATSTEKGLTKLREARMQALGLKSTQEYRNFLEPRILIDPIDFAQHTANKKAAFVVSVSDTTVPTQTQYDLAKVWGPGSIFKEGSPGENHVKVIVRTLQEWLGEVTEFLKSN